ncbi:glycosyltransferase [Pseudomonas umsongensis]|nr:glycosyltransferase [Pseudomonas umsongensis]
MSTSMNISIVIPCFNAADKIGRCLSSLRKIEFQGNRFEAIFIDDCSTDGTYELIKKESEKELNWRVFCLEKNSGSPSRPRNRGIKEAKGKYIYFLDCDDEIIPTALKELYRLAENTSADLVRSELIAEDGKQRKLMNRLSNWNENLTPQQRREMIISGQSTTVDSFIRKDLLLRKNIYWPEHLRMGEDTVFLANVLSNSERIEYLTAPAYIYYKLPSLTPASTQRYGRRELRDHLEVWETAQEIMMPAGVNYITKRLHVGLRVALESLIFRNRGDIDDTTFKDLARFVNSYWSLIQNFNYTQRLKDVLAATREGDFLTFSSLIRPRLLIAGYDLKFIADAISELDAYFDIRIDQWKGHEAHDEAASLEHLDWAEYIWCEWMLGNAEWYAKHKKPNQRLVIRMHRMELGRAHGERLKMDSVDAVIAVSTFFFERLLERYPNIPRRKARLIHNYVRTEQYRRSWHEDRRFTLGIIGILPSRKGLKIALEILTKLRKHDVRFNLKIFGKRPEELSWIAKDSSEMNYFTECSRLISENNLSESIHFLGHSDITTALEEERVGYVLSVSEADFGFPGPESFHLAVADGFAGGAVSIIRHWPGAEYVWPKSSICKKTSEIIEKIIYLSKSSEFMKSESGDGRRLLLSNYSIGMFSQSVKDLFLEIA